MQFIKRIPEIIEKGNVTFGNNRAFIDYNDKRGLIALDYKGDNKKWLVTAYKKYDAPTPANPHQSRHNIYTSSVNRIDGVTPNPTTKQLINQAKKLNPQEQAKKEALYKKSNEIKGKGFTAQNPQNVTEPLKVEFDMQEWSKLTSGIKLDAQLRADLENLATKHPEMFKKPSDVFKLLVKIKNNPFLQTYKIL